MDNISRGEGGLDKQMKDNIIRTHISRELYFVNEYEASALLIIDLEKFLKEAKEKGATKISWAGESDSDGDLEYVEILTYSTHIETDEEREHKLAKSKADRIRLLESRITGSNRDINEATSELKALKEQSKCLTKKK